MGLVTDKTDDTMWRNLKYLAVVIQIVFQESFRGKAKVLS